MHENILLFVEIKGEDNKQVNKIHKLPLQFRRCHVTNERGFIAGKLRGVELISIKVFFEVSV